MIEKNRNKVKTPCCNADYCNLYKINFKCIIPSICWYFEKWYCENCEKQYTEREMLDHIEKELEKGSEKNE